MRYIIDHGVENYGCKSSEDACWDEKTTEFGYVCNWRQYHTPRTASRPEGHGQGEAEEAQWVRRGLRTTYNTGRPAEYDVLTTNEKGQIEDKYKTFLGN